MSNITITSLSSPTSNVTISNTTTNTETTVSSLTDNTSVITVNQGLPGPPGSGVVSISNYGSSRLLISTGTSDGINADENLLFDGYSLSISGIPVSISGHTHEALSILDFNNSVSGLIPIKDITPGTGISIVSSSGVYTISSINLSNETSLKIPNNGRLTLQSGDPTPNTNLTSSTIYYCPYLGNNIGLYNTDTLSWDMYSFDEISLSLSGMTVGFNYDIFLYYNSNSLVLEKLSWSTDTSRSTSLIYQNGVLVNGSSLNKRYLGTIRAISSNTTEDSSSRRLVYNANNTIYKSLSAIDNISHTYTLNTTRSYRNISTLGLTKCEFVIGINQLINTICNSIFTTETSSSSVGVSLDSTNSFNTLCVNTTTISSGSALILTNTSSDFINVDPGYHYLQTVQSGSTITTFYNASQKTLLLC